MTPEKQEKLWKECCDEATKIHTHYNDFDTMYSYVGVTIGFHVPMVIMRDAKDLFAAEMVKEAYSLTMLSSHIYTLPDILGKLNLKEK